MFIDVTTTYRTTCLACFLAIMPTAALANAFVPTMISANVMWVVAFPVIVFLEGWMMARWKWRSPYLNSFIANLLSAIAALPIGVGLSIAGGFISRDQSWVTSFLSGSARHFLAQLFSYGQLPTPYDEAWLHQASPTGFQMVGVPLAAILFIGICWCLTFAVEGWYYTKRNRTLPRSHIYRGTAVANLASYFVLMVVWLPYPNFFIDVLTAILHAIPR
jgi:hypothetical protein